MCLISIIVPVYNVEEYLNKCIDSLINQTLTDIEIVLVDDGSTDQSGKICDKYASIDGRIKVIHKINGGLSDARNVGIKASNGKYLAFVDSDDWVEINIYEKLYNLIEKSKADIAQCNFKKVYSDEIKQYLDINEDVKIYNGEEILYNLYSENCGKNIVVWNKLYKKELFENIEFPKGKLHEDEFTTYKLFHKSNYIIESNMRMYYYRQRSNSIMNSKFNIRRLDVIEAWEERAEYFKLHNLKELSQITEAKICFILKKFYIDVFHSSIENKKEVLKYLSEKMKKKYINFIKNRYITTKGKLILSLCILNRKIFYIIYNRHIIK